MLAEFGTKFTLVPHSSSDKLFILEGDKPAPTPNETKEIKIDIEDEPVDDLPLDIQLADMLADDVDKNEISEFDYTLK